MRYVKPHYYDAFCCSADKCPDTCCAGWQIMIDDDSLNRYSQLKGGFGSRIANSIDWQEGCFLQYKGRCALLNQENLCDMVTELGEEYLCETCSRYPRHIEEFEGLREMSLSLSCPVAAKMILNCEEGLELIQEEDEAEDPLDEEFDDFDVLLFTQLEDARNVLFQIVQGQMKQGESTISTNDCSMEKRMHLILEMAAQMQDCVDEGRLYDMEKIIVRFSEADIGEMQVRNSFLSEREGFLRLREGFEVLKRLERLRDEWSSVLTGAWDTLYAKGEEHYLKIRGEFLREYGCGGRFYADWQLFLKNLLLSFLYTYFCGAVYDDWIYSKAAFAVFSVVYVQEFVMFRFISSDKDIDKHDWVELAYRYAREVEHSDDNLNLLEEWFQNSRQGRERN